MQALVSPSVSVEIVASFVDSKAIESTIGVVYPSFALWVIFLFPILIFVSLVVDHGWYVNSIFPISALVVNEILPTLIFAPNLMQFNAPGPPELEPL